jgi:hypothetical protein
MIREMHDAKLLMLIGREVIGASVGRAQVQEPADGRGCARALQPLTPHARDAFYACLKARAERAP